MTRPRARLKAWQRALAAFEAAMRGAGVPATDGNKQQDTLRIARENYIQALAAQGKKPPRHLTSKVE